MQKWIFEIRSRPFVVLAGVFLLATLLVVTGTTVGFDRPVSQGFHELAGDPVLDTVMWAITEAGDIYYMLIFGVVLLIIRRTRKIGVTLLVCLVLGTLATGYLKCGISQDSPDLIFEGTDFPIPSSIDTFPLFCYEGFSSSFPSGHAARAATFGVVLGYALSGRFPRGCYLLLLYPLLMALSRVYVLQHYPMDVIGGVVLGILIAGAIGHKSKLYTIIGPASHRRGY